MDDDDDDRFDDPDRFDLSTREGMTFAIATGLFDDDTCPCRCGCQRSVLDPDEPCDECAAGEHADGSAP